jgi:trimethylamine:corrinoid methyltransferase-like protein
MKRDAESPGGTGPTPLRLSRPELLSAEQAGRIHALARRILQEVGLEVRHEPALARLVAEGFRVQGRRAFFEPAVVEQFVDEMCGPLSSRPAARPVAGDEPIQLRVSSYSLYVHDIDSDRVLPYSSDRLVEMCKLTDSLADAGVHGAPPGIPMDVHPDLQPLAQYRIAALHARQGAAPVDPTSARTVNHLLDMAEVMGRPIGSLPVYVPSPLRLGGESLEVVLACLDRLSYITVSSMPSTGATAPLHPFAALALAAAEVIGGAITVQLLTGKPAGFGVGIFPFDLRAGAMVFGSPENLLFQMLCADFQRFYGAPGDHAPGNVHVMAKRPDSQAAAEKAAIMALGASLGARHFASAGTLSLDEIFSPLQLLVDCEIRDWVQRAVQGVWLGEEVVDDWLAEVRAGVERGFTAVDSTLDHYRRHTWFPQRFDRTSVGPWLAAGQPHLADRLRDEVRRRIAGHDYALEDGRRQQIEKIYRQAQKAVAG